MTAGPRQRPLRTELMFGVLLYAPSGGQCWQSTIATLCVE
jgi:hypothetical protein